MIGLSLCCTGFDCVQPPNRVLGIPSMPQVQMMEARTLPEIPFSYLTVASAGLIVIFLFGITFPHGNREPEMVADQIEERKEERYRKAV